MTIKEIVTLITTKGYVFQISIPNTNFSHGKTTIQNALADSENLESYFEKIARVNKASSLLIKTFTPNGSSYKSHGDYLIFLPQTEPVATSATTFVADVATSYKNHVATSKEPLKGLPETTPEPQNKAKNTPMDTKDYIDFRVLQTEHKNLEQRYDDSKNKITKLEKKIEELHDENKQLLRDNATKEDKHSLALERAKLEMEREGKEGLSGILGELQENPMLIEAVVGFLNPKHPMFDKNKEQKALAGAEQENQEIKYTADEQVNLVLNDIPRKLSQTNGDTISKIYLLFQEFLAKPDILHTVANTYFPEIFK